MGYGNTRNLRCARKILPLASKPMLPMGNCYAPGLPHSPPTYIDMTCEPLAGPFAWAIRLRWVGWLSYFYDGDDVMPRYQLSGTWLAGFQNFRLFRPQRYGKFRPGRVKDGRWSNLSGEIAAAIEGGVAELAVFSSRG